MLKTSLVEYTNTHAYESYTKSIWRESRAIIRHLIRPKNFWAQFQKFPRHFFRNPADESLVHEKTLISNLGIVNKIATDEVLSIYTIRNLTTHS
jgi:hypothetical protein